MKKFFLFAFILFTAFCVNAQVYSSSNSKKFTEDYRGSYILESEGFEYKIITVSPTEIVIGSLTLPVRSVKMVGGIKAYEIDVRENVPVYAFVTYPILTVVSQVSEYDTRKYLFQFKLN
jgi:hypothetical protein